MSNQVKKHAIMSVIHARLHLSWFDGWRLMWTIIFAIGAVFMILVFTDVIEVGIVEAIVDPTDPVAVVSDGNKELVKLLMECQQDAYNLWKPLRNLNHTRGLKSGIVTFGPKELAEMLFEARVIMEEVKCLQSQSGILTQNH
jgi:hypothetical protein